ncbi:hypothetical protein PGQ11_004007 [Apiospora arundinis]|uniref:Uncharacterized protein n=1 Tax=Apiospora arundinis TaxID=335852 RepID=A0ABR2J6V2_9PEZI
MFINSRNFLLEIASWGASAIVYGTPNNGGKGTYAYMDTSRVAAVGMRCGGTEAYAQVRKEDEEDKGRLGSTGRAGCCGHLGCVVLHWQQRPAGRVDRIEQEPK